MSRVLYLMRHGEAEGFAPSFRDRDRPLTERGKDQARAAGDHLRAWGLPSAVLVSSAMRTRQTAEAMKLGVNLQYVDALYDAGSMTIAEELLVLGEDVTSALVVGHAPGIPSLAHALADPRNADADALDRLHRGWPTATLARFEIDGSWHDVVDSRARLTHVAWN